MAGLVLIACYFYFIRQPVVKFGEFGSPAVAPTNATLRFLPESGPLNKGDTQRIALELSTGGQTINAVQTTVVYNPQKVTINEILTEYSFCQLFPVKIINPTVGEVTIACGLPSPGFSETTGTVVELLMHLNQAGTFSLKFKNSLVLANDGQGTNVLGAAADVEYQVVNSQ